MLDIHQTRGRATLAHSRWFIHGPGKIGKSTFASGWPHSFFLSTERRLDHIQNIRYTYMQDWEAFKEVVKELKEQQYRQMFKTIVVDTIDLVYQYCWDFVKEAREFEHPSDEKYGKGYDFLDSEFKLYLFKLLALPYAIIFVSHTTPREIFTERGTKTKLTSTLPDRVKKIIFPHMGVIGYMAWDVQEVKRDGQLQFVDVPIMHFKGSADYEAGDGEGCLPEKLICYRDPRRTFASIQQCYQQHQKQLASNR